MPLRKLPSAIASQALFFVLYISVSSILAAQSNPRPNAATAQPKKPKCVFLRREAARVARAGQDFVDEAPLARVRNAGDLSEAGGTMADWASYVANSEIFAAQEGFLRMDAEACEKNVRLSEPSRLNDLSRIRSAHFKRIIERWRQLSGESGKDLEPIIVAQVGSVYDAETKAFYNPELTQFEDPDIGKDYAELLPAINNSAIDQGTKAFYKEYARYLRYEEAGQLSNILKGIDQKSGLDYVYLLRNRLTERAAIVAQSRDQISRQRVNDWKDAMITYSIVGVTAILVLTLLWFWMDRARAKYRGIRSGAIRSPFWGGSVEWVFWEPGETVVILEHKRLVPMVDPRGGYRTISAWKGQEFKGKISYKTQFSTWTSDPILTSDGLAVNLGLGVWWKIANAGEYVSKVASDYHEGSQHYGVPLPNPEHQVQPRREVTDFWTKEAAEFWIRKLAAGTLREQINQLPAEKLISPYVQRYIQVERGSAEEQLAGAKPIPDFMTQLSKAQEKLNEKSLSYGIEIDRLEVQELILPPIYQKKLEAVRVAFLEPTQQRALTEAQKIALSGLAEIIGEDKVGLIEILKHIDFSKMSMNPFTGVMPITQPIINKIQEQTENTLPSESSARALPKAAGGGNNN